MQGACARLLRPDLFCLHVEPIVGLDQSQLSAGRETHAGGAAPTLKVGVAQRFCAEQTRVVAHVDIANDDTDTVQTGKRLKHRVRIDLDVT